MHNGTVVKLDSSQSDEVNVKQLVDGKIETLAHQLADIRIYDHIERSIDGESVDRFSVSSSSCRSDEYFSVTYSLCGSGGVTRHDYQPACDPPMEVDECVSSDVSLADYERDCHPQFEWEDTVPLAAGPAHVPAFTAADMAHLLLRERPVESAETASVGEAVEDAQRFLASDVLSQRLLATADVSGSALPWVYDDEPTVEAVAADIRNLTFDGLLEYGRIRRMSSKNRAVNGLTWTDAFRLRRWYISFMSNGVGDTTFRFPSYLLRVWSRAVILAEPECEARQVRCHI